MTALELARQELKDVERMDAELVDFYTIAKQRPTHLQKSRTIDVSAGKHVAYTRSINFLKRFISTLEAEEAERKREHHLESWRQSQ